MTTREQNRLTNLELVINELGTLTKLAKLITEPGRPLKSTISYLSMVRRQTESESGRPRNLGSKVARRIETALNKPLGWMDEKHDLTNPTSRAIVDNTDVSLDALAFAELEHFIDRTGWDISHVEKAMLLKTYKIILENHYGVSTNESGSKDKSKRGGTN